MTIRIVEASPSLSTAPGEKGLSEFLGDVTLNFDIRPVTLSYIVRWGSRAGFVRAVRLASNRWGGGRELIVPMDDNDLAEPWKDGITRVFPPDLLVDLADLEPSVEAEVASSVGVQVAKWTARSLYQFDGLHQLATFDSDALHELDLVVPKISTFQSAAAMGLIARGAEHRQWEQFGVHFTETDDPTELAIAQLTDRTVLSSTLHECGQIYMQGASPHSIVVYVTQQEDDLEDAIYYWNLRASLPLVEGRCLAFAASPEVLRAPNVREALANRIATVERYGRYAGPTIIVHSRTSSEGELQDLVRELGFDLVERPLGETIRRSRLESPPRTASVTINPLRVAPSRQDFGRRAFAPTQLHRPKTVLRSTTPVKFNPEIGGYVFARFSGAHAIDVPGSASLGRMFMQVAKATRAGIEFLTTPATDYHFEFTVPESAAVLHELMRDRGIEFQLNDKGRQAHGILAMCGGTWSHSDETSTAILRALVTPRSAHLVTELKIQYPEVSDAVAAGIARRFGQDVRQRTLSLGEIASAIATKEQDIASTLDALVTAALVVRGLMIRCDTCGLSSFTSAASPTEVPQCPACGSMAEFERNSSGKEPGFWYRLNALVDRATDQGALAVLLGYRAIKAAHPETDLLLGVDLTFSDRSPGDLDILGRLNRELLAGEAKMSPDEFTDEQVALDIEKAVRLRVDIQVLCCPTILPAELSGRIRERFNSNGVRVWIVSAPSNIAS